MDTQERANGRDKSPVVRNPRHELDQDLFKDITTGISMLPESTDTWLRGLSKENNNLPELQARFLSSKFLANRAGMDAFDVFRNYETVSTTFNRGKPINGQELYAQIQGHIDGTAPLATPVYGKRMTFQRKVRQQIEGTGGEKAMAWIKQIASGGALAAQSIHTMSADVFAGATKDAVQITQVDNGWWDKEDARALSKIQLGAGNSGPDYVFDDLINGRSTKGLAPEVAEFVDSLKEKYKGNIEQFTEDRKVAFEISPTVQFGIDMQEFAQEYREEIRDYYAVKEEHKSMIPEMIGSTAAFLSMPPTMISAMYQQQSDDYLEVKGKSIDELTPLEDQERIGASMAMGVIGGALNRVGLNAIKPKVTGKVARAIGSLMSTGKAAATEAATEELEQVVSNVIAQTYDENRAAFEGAGESATPAAITAVVIRAILGGANAGQARISANNVAGEIESLVVSDNMDIRPVAQSEEELTLAEDSRADLVDVAKAYRKGSVSAPEFLATVSGVGDPKVVMKDGDYMMPMDWAMFSQRYSKERIASEFSGKDLELISKAMNGDRDAQEAYNQMVADGEAGYNLTEEQMAQILEQAKKDGNSKVIDLLTPSEMKIQQLLLEEKITGESVDQVELSELKVKAGIETMKLPNEVKFARSKTRKADLIKELGAESEQKLTEESIKTASEEVKKGEAEKPKDPATFSKLQKARRKLAKLEEGYRSRERSNIETISELENYVNKLPGEVQRKYRGWFKKLSKAKKVETKEKRLAEALEKADELMEAHTKKVLQDKISNLIKKTDKNIAKAKKGESVAVPDEIAYQRFKDMMDAASEQSAERVNDIESKLVNEEMTEEDYASLLKSNFKDADSEQLAGYLADLEALVLFGKTAKQVRDEEREERHDAIASAIVKQVKESNDSKGKKYVDGSGKGGAGVFGKVNLATTSPQALVMSLQGNREGELYDLIIKQLNDAAKGRSVASKGHEDYLAELLKKHNLDYAGMSGNKLININGKDVDTDTAMFVYAHSKNANSRNHLLNTKWGSVNKKLTEADIDAISGALSPNARSFVDDIHRYNDTVVYDRLNEWFFDRNQVNMPKEEFYMPITGLNPNGSIESLFNDYSRAFVNRGMTKMRTGSNAGFKGMNFASGLTTHYRNLEQIISTRNPIMEINSIISRPEVRDEMERKWKGSYDYLRDYLKRVGSGKLSTEESAVGKALDWMRTGSSIALVGLNPSSILKVPTSTIIASRDVKASFLAKSIVRLAANPLKEIGLAESRNDNLKFRQKEYNRELNEILNSNGGPFAKKLNKTKRQVAEAGFFMHRTLDRSQAAALYNAKYEEKIAEGLSQEEADAEAERLIRENLPSGRVEDLPPIYTTDAFQRAIASFTVDLNVNLNLARRLKNTDEMSVYKIASYAAAMAMASWWLATTDFFGDTILAMAGLKDAKTEEEVLASFATDLTRYASSQFIGGIPLGGLVAENAGVALLDLATDGEYVDDAAMYYMSEVRIPAFSGINALLQGDFIKGAGLLGGVPGTLYLDRWLNEVFEEDDGINLNL